VRGEPLPLLVVHDGPEYADYSAILRLLEHAVAENRIPLLRAALLQPVDRNETYSASAAYARALATELVPAIEEAAPTPSEAGMRIGMGASLGALAMLHAQRRYPQLFGGLFLQSGSYFRQRWDSHESSFGRFRRITRFVGRVLAGDEAAVPVPTVMTWGTVEENQANNRAVRDALLWQGYPVRWVEVRDGHNWIAWRDSLHPALPELIEDRFG
jgi:enterochelin esterase family protein